MVGSFFFQAEDGIRDRTVTGVQTCALPIFLVINDLLGLNEKVPKFAKQYVDLRQTIATAAEAFVADVEAGTFPDEERSEERRVGKEWRARGWPQPEATNTCTSRVPATATAV